MSTRARDRTGRTRGALVTGVLAACMAWSHPARADECRAEDRITEDTAESITTRLTGRPVSDEMLAQLEALDRCGDIALLLYHLDEAFYSNIQGAIFVVAAIGRKRSRVTRNEVALASLLARNMIYASEARAIRGYMADKFVHSPRREALMAFAVDTIPDRAQDRIAATTSERVPRGAWERPGSQPVPFYIGNEAHRAIARYYKDSHPNDDMRFNSTPIATILHRLAETGMGASGNLELSAVGAFASRPDIVNLTTQEIYEIKPAGMESHAAALVAGHVQVFASAGVTMSPGRRLASGTTGVVPAPAGHYRFHSPRRGVIVYRYHRGDYVPASVPARARQTQTDERPSITGHELAQAVPVPIAIRKSDDGGFWNDMSRRTGLTGSALTLYVMVSVGTRAIPVRNLVPLP